MASVLEHPRERTLRRLGGGARAFADFQLAKQQREQQFQDLMDAALLKAKTEGNIDIDPNSPSARRLGTRGYDLTGVTPRQKSGEQFKELLDYTTLVKNLHELGLSPSGRPMAGETGEAPDASAQMLGQPRPPLPEVRPTKFKSTLYGGVSPTEFEPMEIPTSEAGRVTLAEESLTNIEDILAILYPKGTPASFQREIAFRSNLPGISLPFMGRVTPQVSPDNPLDPSDTLKAERAQNVFRKMGAALSGRKLIETGVAARPEETAKLVAQFAPGLLSNPKAAMQGLQELRKFYQTYLDIVKTRSADTAPFNGQENPSLPSGATEEDIQFTMQKHGLTRDEVLQRLGR